MWLFFEVYIKNKKASLEMNEAFLVRIICNYGTKAFGTGRSPFCPKVWIKVPAVDLFTYQVEFDGRKTAASDLPSPS